jgi:ubiquinone biosynthesis accessory factor UbiK
MSPFSPLQKLFDGINEALGHASLKPEVEQRLRQALQGALTQMDLVTREEFDAQSKVLQRTREQLEALEKELAVLATQIDIKS